ncbi:MAG: ABC transporter substrate-binding protein [Actinomycetota bacterium]|nr:ABC transporter substrate-binding protein [Actinomycetota bacterium]
MNRREFLRLSGAGLAGAALLGAASCGGGEQGQGGPDITFTFGPDKVVPDLVDQFNEQNDSGIQVTYREMPADTGQYFDQLQTELQSGASEIDVIAGDVTWPAQLAANGWVIDLSDRFTEDMREDFLSAPLQTNTYEGRVYGVPWQVGAGMLYYRSDLLEKSGFSGPPKTWDELKEQAQKVQQDSGSEYGYVFQGADYEGGVVNGLEYIWTHGGEVLDQEGSESVAIDSPESTEALRTERSMLEDGIAPQGVTTYKEQESQQAFLRGDAVFLRYWPNAYELLSDESQSSISPEQVGIAPLPVSSAGKQSFSALGGWGMLINAASQNQDAAWEFIEFMTAYDQLKFRAMEGGYLPSRHSLYSDGELLDAVRIMELGWEAIQNSRPRPVSPYYSDMSVKMAEQFNASLNGETSPEEAVSTLQSELSEIIRQAGEA